MPTANPFAPYESLCQSLPGAEYYLMHSHPAYRVGKKCFAIMGGHGDQGENPSMSVKVPLMEQSIYTEMPGIARTHYIGQHGWITCDLTAGLDPAFLNRLVVGSWRLAAPKRAVAKYDAERAGAPAGS